MKDKKLYPIFKHGLIVILFICTGSFLLGNKNRILNLSNSLAVLGLIYILVGLFNLVRNLGFFDLLDFGFKKFLSILFPKKKFKEDFKNQDYVNYISNKKYNKTYFKFLSVGFIWIILSLIVFYIN